MLQAVRDSLPEWHATDADIAAEFARQKDAQRAASTSRTVGAALPGTQPPPPPSTDATSPEEMPRSSPTRPAAASFSPFAPPEAASFKVKVYLSGGGSDPAKILMVPPRTAFHDFSAAVEQKWSRKMRLSFIDGDGDEAEIDDDDSLEAFLSQPVSKLKLRCTPLDAIVQFREDGAAGVVTGVVVAATSAPPQGIIERLTLTRPPFDAADCVDRGGGAAAPPRSSVAPEVPHRQLKTFCGHTRAVYGCAFAPDGDERFVTASGDKSVRVWNVADGTIRVMQGGEDDSGYVSCDFSSDGETVVSSSLDGTVRLWSASTCQHLHKLKGHGGTKAYCTQFSPSGAHVLSGGCDRKVRVWNMDTATQVARLKGHRGSVFSCCFSNTDGGKHCVSGSEDRTVKIWDWRETREVRTFSGHAGIVWSCRFSNSDRYIISATAEHELKLWDAGSGQLICNIVGHMAPIHDALFTSNDKYVLSCARDRTVMVWEAETGRHVDTLTGHTNTVYHMDIQGNMLLTVSLDATVQLWQLNLP